MHTTSKIVWATLGFALLLSGCDNLPFGDDEPTRDELIEAVRGVMRGTYTETVPVEKRVKKTRTVTRRCSQFDYDTDPYKDYSELGKCRGYSSANPYGSKKVPQTYWETETEMKSETRPCPVPPPATSGEWVVKQMADNRWNVSNSRGMWQVFSASGGRLVAQSDVNC